MSRADFEVWTVARPKATAEEAFALCNQNVQDAGLKARMESCTTEIRKAAQNYEGAAERAQVHELRSTDYQLSHVTPAEVLAAYKQRFADPAGSARSIYDAIRNAPKYGRCPMCGHRDVSSVDHNMPKSQFPALALCPLNLVPACAVCNKTKLAQVPANEEDQLLHPYFDNVEGEQWLFGKVVDVTPAAIRFFAGPPTHWAESMRARVIRQFKVLQLGTLYASQAAQELAAIRRDLRHLFTLTGTDGVRWRLDESARSRFAEEPNHWRTATYQAVAASDWYCGGGFGVV